MQKPFIGELPNQQNDEQRDADQAQDVATDAINLKSNLIEESEHGGQSNIGSVIPEDTLEGLYQSP